MDPKNWSVAFWILAALILIHMYYMGSVKIYRFYRPTCSACKASQREWDNFYYATMFSRIKPVSINTEYIDNVKLIDNFRVRSVPSIWKVYPDGRRVEYHGNRSVDDLVNFSLSEN